MSLDIPWPNTQASPAPEPPGGGDVPGPATQTTVQRISTFGMGPDNENENENENEYENAENDDDQYYNDDDQYYHDDAEISSQESGDEVSFEYTEERPYDERHRPPVPFIGSETDDDNDDTSNRNDSSASPCPSFEGDGKGSGGTGVNDSIRINIIDDLMNEFASDNDEEQEEGAAVEEHEEDEDEQVRTPVMRNTTTPSSNSLTVVDANGANEFPLSTHKDDTTNAVVRSLPTNKHELRALLTELDGDCPYDNDKDNNEDDATTSLATTKASYVSQDVRVEAAAILKIPIPIFVTGSKIKYTINIKDYDIRFGIQHQPQRQTANTNNDNDDDNNDENGTNADADDDDNGTKTDEDATIILVDPHMVYHLDDPSIVEAPDVAGPEKGEFVMETMEHASSLVFVFDNSYSWMTEKYVSYSITVTPPYAPQVLQRRDRVQAILPGLALEITQEEMNLRHAQQHTEHAEQLVLEIKDRITNEHKRFQHEEQTLNALQVELQGQETVREETLAAIAAYRVEGKGHKEQLREIDDQIQALQVQRSTIEREHQRLGHTMQEAIAQIRACQETQHTVHEKIVQTEDTMERIHVEIDTITHQYLSSAEHAFVQACTDEQHQKKTVHFLHHHVVPALHLRLLEDDDA